MSPFGWACLIGAVGWMLYVLWDEFIRPNRGDGKGGFWDFVKNPGRFKNRAALTRPGKEWELPDNSDPSAWDVHIRAAIEQQWDVFEYTRMADRSPQIAPAAARLMQDIEFVRIAWVCEEKDLPRWNLSALERLLGRVVPISVLGKVLPFLEHENKWCRNTAAEILGRIDFPEAAEAIRKCIRSEDEKLRTGVMYGMCRTVHEREGCRELIIAVWDDLVESFRTERIYYDNVVGIVGRMASADRDRAVRDLHAPEVLRVYHRNLDNILRGLRAADILPEKQKILDFAEAWKNEPISEKHSAYHRGEVLGACMWCLLPPRGQQADKAIGALVGALMEDHDGKTRSSMCPAYLRINGIDSPYNVCYSIVYERRGLLTQPQRRYWEVSLLLNEVQNGGWHQYFVNSSGDGWKACLEGAEEMGLAGVVEDMKKAIGAFGSSEPSTNRDQRWEQLSKLSKHQDGILEELGIDGDAVELALAKYAVKYRDDFVPLEPLGIQEKAE
jgi:hypothetical protein